MTAIASASPGKLKQRTRSTSAARRALDAAINVATLGVAFFVVYFFAVFIPSNRS